MGRAHRCPMTMQKDTKRSYQKYVGFLLKLGTVLPRNKKTLRQCDQNSQVPTAAVLNVQPSSAVPHYSMSKPVAAIVIAILSFSSKSLRMSKERHRHLLLEKFNANRYFKSNIYEHSLSCLVQWEIYPIEAGTESREERRFDK